MLRASATRQRHRQPFDPSRNRARALGELFSGCTNVTYCRDVSGNVSWLTRTGLDKLHSMVGGCVGCRSGLGAC